MNTATPLLLDMDSFLARAEERGTPLDVRAAEAVLGLLALGEARRRTGLPEPTEELAEELLHILLPLYVSATEEELPGFVAALVALVDHTHEAGRLNAKRHAKLMARVHELAEGFTQAMTSPRRLTWPRLYGNLLRAAGVDATDPRAVRDWLEAFAATRPHPERHAALGFASSASSSPNGPLAEAAYVEALCAERSRQARPLLAARLEAVALAQQVRPRPGEGLLVADAPVGKPDDERDDWYDEQAGVLADRWTAAGLDTLLRGPFAHLAPSGGSAATPLLALVEAMAGQHLEMFGDAFAPLPPAPLPASPEEQAALLRSAPLPQLLAQAAADPQGADERTRELALASGFLVREQGGTPSAGPSAEAWREGGPAELTGLALNLLGALLAQPAEEEETAEEYEGEHLITLYLLCEQAGMAQSVARMAALNDMWFVPPGHESDPDTSVPATGDYELPDPQALSALLGLPALTESDRTDLIPSAARLVRLMDRLAALGMTERAGDALSLTPLGSALLRDALLLGLGGEAADVFPTREQMLAWDAERLVAAAQWWPKRAARPAVGDWLAAQRTGGWTPLFAAISAACPEDEPARRRALLATLDATAVPDEALYALLADPVLGGWAEHTLHARGQGPDASAVPLSARAVYLVDALEAVRSAASLDHRMTAAANEEEPELFAEVHAAFDKAAAAWPGGAPALLTALTASDPYASAFLAEQLSHHPDRATAEQARRAWRAFETSGTTRSPGRKKPAKRAGGKRKRR
ncbi:hypothetical protein [Streptomyces sp. NBC_01294]|uniref:hypothetical protein n=1 Tax=Streptomyces sp. NBC_01294 TaxID=2903815 RepID=UPI002DDA14C0|nr:hypothetical protein [Streptomyces sp. NBC_01294]WRZ57079.1 hypothetical protein OG534_11660 [Streptomyces sp. NBC_01294]